MVWRLSNCESPEIPNLFWKSSLASIHIIGTKLDKKLRKSEKGLGVKLEKRGEKHQFRLVCKPGILLANNEGK